MLLSFLRCALSSKDDKHIVSMDYDESDYTSAASGDLRSSLSLLLISRDFAHILKIRLLISSDSETLWHVTKYPTVATS